MPTLIDTKIRNLQVLVDSEIMNGRRMVRPNWEAVAVKKTQAQTTGLYAWMNDIPLIQRKTANGYVRSGVSTQAFTLSSEEQGLFLEMKKSDFRDAAASGDLGKITDMATAFGRRIEEFPQDGVFGLLKEGDQSTLNGRSILAYDGLSFFNDSHYTNGRSSAGGTYDNNLTSTALSATNFAAAEAALALLPDNRGKALNQPVTHLIVPPQLATTGADILYARTVSTGGVNSNSNAERAARGLAPVELVVAPELGGDATTWYVCSRSMGRAPIIYQETEPLMVIPLIEETMPHVLYDNLYIWACKGECVFGFGDPRTTIRCIA